MARWKRFKEGDKRRYSIIYKQYSKDWGGWYLGGDLKPGDFYIPVDDLGEPKETEDAELTVLDIRDEVRRRLTFYKDGLIGQTPEDLPRHYQLIGGQSALRSILKFITGEDEA